MARDPTAHNLLPFEILFGVALALGWIGVVAISRRLFARVA